MFNLSHVGIIVRDMDEAVNFYTTVLDYTIANQFQDENLQITLMKAGNQEIELLKFTHEHTERKEGIISHIAFSVADIEEEIKRLKTLGVKLTNDKPRAAMNGLKIFFFTGPSGESIEFVQG